MHSRYKLSGIQEFTISLTRGDDSSIISPAGIRIKGELNLAKLEKSIQKLVNESDAMRMVFVRDEETNTICQEVLDSYHYKLDMRDTPDGTDEQKEEFIRNDLFGEERRIEYLPDGEVKWFCILYRYRDADYSLWFVMSHILADGLSITNALTRIVLRYNGIPFPASSSYLEFIKDQYRLESDPDCIRQREAVFEGIKDYTPPADYSQMGQTESFYREMVTLKIDNLKKFARANKMSLFHCTLFMFHAAVAAAYRTNDSLIGVAVNARKLKSMSSIGEFLTGYADRNSFRGDDRMREMAVRCKERYLAESRKDIAMYDLFRNGTEFILSYQNYGDISKDIKLGKATARPYENIDYFMKPFHWANLSLDAYEAGNELSVCAGFDDIHFDEKMFNRMKNAFIVANRALSDEDMTFSEYCKTVDEISE